MCSYQIVMYETRVRNMSKRLAVYIPSTSKLPPCDTFCCDIEEGKLVYRCGEVCSGRKIKLRRQPVRGHTYCWLTIPAIYARMLGIEEGTKVRVSFGEEVIVIEIIGKEG